MFSARAAAALTLAFAGTGVQIVAAAPGTGGFERASDVTRVLGVDPFGREAIRAEAQRMTRQQADFDRIVTAHAFGPDEFAWTRVGDPWQRYRNAAAPSVSYRPAQPQSGYG
jgi:hypothetical protein